jgi:hypothetical protein
MQEVKKMFKRSFVAILIAVLVLFGAVVTNSSAVDDNILVSHLFEKTLYLANTDLLERKDPGAALEKVPLLLDELMSQGIIILSTPAGEVETDTGVVKVEPEMEAASTNAHNEFLKGADAVIGLTEELAHQGALATVQGDRVVEGALQVEKFLVAMRELSIQARDFIAQGVITPIRPIPIPIQILNPLFFSLVHSSPASPLADRGNGVYSRNSHVGFCNNS